MCVQKTAEQMEQNMTYSDIGSRDVRYIISPYPFSLTNPELSSSNWLLQKKFTQQLFSCCGKRYD